MTSLRVQMILGTLAVFSACAFGQENSAPPQAAMQTQAATQTFRFLAGPPPIPAPPNCAGHTHGAAHLNVCQIFTQAGIPYSGPVAEFFACEGFKAGDFSPAVIWQPGSNQTYDIHDITNTGYMGGMHVWPQSGDYVLSVGFEINCFDINRNWHEVCATGAPCNKQGSVQVSDPQPPVSVFVDQTVRLRPNQTFVNVASVTVAANTSQSGTMLKLSTSQPGLVDIQTRLGSTSRTDATVYVWLPQTQTSVTYDLVIDRRASVGLRATLTSDCAGSIFPGSKCDPAQGPSKSVVATVR
jgi:hypothetical protein